LDFVICWSDEKCVPPGSPPYENQLLPAVGADCAAQAIASENTAVDIDVLFMVIATLDSPSAADATIPVAALLCFYKS
jgi:hypothetical protein